MVDSNCRVCGCDNTKIINVQEKHYATFDKFDYLKCEECNSLSIKNIPHDIARYYQADTYYSFKKIEYNTKSFKSLLKSIYWKKIIVSNHLIFNFLKKLKRLDDSNFFVILRNTNINLKSKILDIGCGSGDILKQLHSFGFKNLLGIEPNIEEDISIKKNKLIIKTMLEDYVEKCKEKFDLIMLNHSFEHMPNPNEILDSIKKISHKDTCLLLRIPLANSYAHRKYNENWVQLDAPRHLFLYSEGGGVLELFDKAGFECMDIIYDSTDFQFWGSEQYIEDIALVSENSFSVNPESSIFSADDILNYKNKATKLNLKKDGDMAAFLFRIK